MAIELVPLYHLEMKTGPILMLTNGPLGTRTIVPIAQGRIEGERLRGRTLPTTADWFVASTDGVTGLLDVRGAAETDDGALVYVSYAGRTDLSGGVGSAPLYGAPLFETGDARYRWLNVVQAVAKGHISGDLSEITADVYEVR